MERLIDKGEEVILEKGGVGSCTYAGTPSDAPHEGV